MDELARKQLLVLVGPKGSGKTTLGRMLEQRLSARFVHVERVAQRVLAECGGVADERYARRAQRAVLDELAVQAADSELLVIESSGASGETRSFFATLRERYELLFVRVHAQRATCDARLAEREQASQVHVPPELIARMYELSNHVSLPWDLELDNDTGLDARSVAEAVRPLLRD
jgi:shikimate kinase